MLSPMGHRRRHPIWVIAPPAAGLPLNRRNEAHPWPLPAGVAPRRGRMDRPARLVTWSPDPGPLALILGRAGRESGDSGRPGVTRPVAARSWEDRRPARKGEHDGGF